MCNLSTTSLPNPALENFPGNCKCRVNPWYMTICRFWISNISALSRFCWCLELGVAQWKGCTLPARGISKSKYFPYALRFSLHFQAVKDLQHSQSRKMKFPGCLRVLRTCRLRTHTYSEGCWESLLSWLARNTSFIQCRPPRIFASLCIVAALPGDAIQHIFTFYIANRSLAVVKLWMCCMSSRWPFRICGICITRHD